MGDLLGGAISIGADLLGSGSKNKAANKAAKATVDAANINKDLYEGIYDKNSATLAPYIGLGTSAAPQYADAVSKGPFGETLASLMTGSAVNPGSFDNFKDSTNYEWRMNEGIRGVNTKFGARGALQSGAAQKGIVDYAGNMASEEYGDYIGQLRDYLTYGDAFARGERAYATDQNNTWMGNLGNLINWGANAAGNQAGVGNTFATNTANANNQSANAQQNAALLQGYNNNNMYTSIGDTLGGLLSKAKFG